MGAGDQCWTLGFSHMSTAMSLKLSGLYHLEARFTCTTPAAMHQYVSYKAMGIPVAANHHPTFPPCDSFIKE